MNALYEGNKIQTRGRQINAGSLSKAPYMTVAESMAQADRVKRDREIQARQARYHGRIPIAEDISPAQDEEEKS
jgi:hypothetical protein